MLRLSGSLLFAASALAQGVHHLFVGTSDGNSLYALEANEETRRITMIKESDASGASPSIVFDSTQLFLFGSRPSEGTLSKYSIESDYSLVRQGTTDIPDSCNTTKFTSLHLTSGVQPGFIFGSASTGECSTVFSISRTGSNTLRSKEIAGDIHSLAWSPDGSRLHALDSHSSNEDATSILNFHITEDANLEDLTGTDVLANISHAAQIITHPTINRMYLVTKDTNELITVSHSGNATSDSLARFRVLPSSLDATQYTTKTLAISSSNTTLWTLSQSSAQAVITVFSLDSTTGEVINAIARAAWQGSGAGMLAPAPFQGNDMVAVTNSPVGYVAMLGLDREVPMSKRGVVDIDGDDFLDESTVMNVEAAARITSFGRLSLGFRNLGEGAWVG